MIKNLKYNLIKKNLFICLILLSLVVLYNLFLIINRSTASKIDNEREKIEASVERLSSEKASIVKIIEDTKKIHEEYLKRLEFQKNLTIDANILLNEVSHFIELLNKFYDNSIFKIRVSNVSQNEDYINLAEISLFFEFSHQLQHSPEVAKELEVAIMKNVYFDILNNYKKLLPIDESLTKQDFDLNTLKIYFIKEK